MPFWGRTPSRSAICACAPFSKTVNADVNLLFLQWSLPNKAMELGLCSIKTEQWCRIPVRIVPFFAAAPLDRALSCHYPSDFRWK